MDNSGKLNLNLVLMGLLGVFLSRLSIGSLIFTLPLLLLAPRFEKQSSKVILTLAAMLVAIVGWIVLDYCRILDPSNRAYLVFALFFPVTSLICSAVWIYVGNRTDSFLRKTVWSLAPAFVLGLAMGQWLTTPSAVPALQTLEGALSFYFPSELMEFDMSSLLSYVFSALAVSFSLMAMVVSMLPLLLSEVAIRRFDDKWQFDFAYMRLPGYYLWIFLGSWVLALMANFVVSVPAWFIVATVNAALSVSFLFMVQGVSIMAAIMRRRNAYLRAGRVIFWVVLFLLLPGVNILVIFGLPLIGVLETWIKFR